MAHATSRVIVAALGLGALAALAYWLGDTRGLEAPAVTPPGATGTTAHSPIVDAPDSSREGAQLTHELAAPQPITPVSSAPATRRISGTLLRAADRTPFGRQVTLGIPVGPGRPPRLVDAGDAFGRFSIEVPAEAELLYVPRFEAGARGRTREGLNRVRWPLPEGTDDVTGFAIELQTGWSVSGHVRSELGTHLVGARVQLHGFETTTDTSGRFDLRDILLPDDVTKAWCHATASEHTPAVHEFLVPDECVIVGPLDLQLPAGGVIEGRVTDALGMPLADASVLIEGATGGHFTIWNRWVPQTHSDTDGRFRLDGVPTGTLIVSARHADGAPERWYGDVHVTAGQTTWVDVVLDGGARVSGRVTDTDGHPLPGVVLKLERLVRWPADADDTGGDFIIEVPGGWERPSHRHREPLDDGGSRLHRERRADLAEAWTDADGRWSVDGVFRGIKRLSVRRAPVGFLPPPARDVHVHDSGDVQVDLVLQPGRSIHGTVQDASGAPVPGFRVQTHQLDLPEMKAITDPRGEFVLHGLPLDELFLEASHPGYRSWDAWVAPDDPPLRIVAEPKLQLHLLVTDARTGLPIPRYVLMMNADGASVMYTVEDAAGRYDDVVDGGDPRELMIRTEGYAFWRSEGQRADGTSIDKPLHVELQPEG